MIYEYTVPWLTVENAHSRELALTWVESDREHLAVDSDANGSLRM